MTPGDAEQAVVPTRTAPGLARRSRTAMAIVAVLVALALAIGVVALTRASSRTLFVPPLSGRALAAAEGTLTSTGLKWSVVHLHRGTLHAHEGIVLAQIPAEGTAVNNGSSVQLTVYGTLTNGPTVKVPDVIGMPEWEAENAIADRGLAPVVLGPRHTGARYQYWRIVAQSPKPGTALPIGSGAVVIHVREPAAIAVTSRLPVTACASSEAPGVHVIAAFMISSAQLRSSPLSDRGPLSRQAPGSLWRLCYVTGHHLIAVSGPPGVARVDIHDAIYIFYGNGMVAEEDSMPSIRFVLSR